MLDVQWRPVGVSNPCFRRGAGKWTPDLNPWFRGKKIVFVLADNDDAGIRHGRKVAQSLRDIVTDVRIVEFPDQQEGGDVSGWLDAGGNREDLLRLCAASAVYKGVSGLGAEQAAEVARLAALHPLEYDRERSSVAERLGVRVGTLDAEVEKERRCAPGPSEDDRLQGRAMALPELELWPQAVEGEHLLRDMVAAIRRHVILSEPEALAAALWVLHAHALAHAEHSPRLHIASPEKRCGKTVLLRTIEPMVPRPLSAENITTSALFRVVEMVHPTLLIDEADAFLTDNEELRGLLNAGHARGGTVIRSVGDDHEPRAFHVWGAVVIAGIGRIPATLEDRSITIHLRRRLPTETIVRLRSGRREHLVDFGRMGGRWVLDHQNRLHDADPRLPDALGDRQQDNWRLLIAIADAISPEWGEKARAAAVAIAKDDVFDEQSASVMALADVSNIFETANKERLSSCEIVDKLLAMEDRPWREWRRGSPLTQNSLARLLNPFSIRPRAIRFAPKPVNPVRGYERGPIEEARARFVDQPCDNATEEGDA